MTQLQRALAFVVTTLTLAALIGGAAMEWQALKDRVSALEKRERYEHGTYTMPTGE